MNDRLENSLEQINFTLQENERPWDFSRVAIRLLNKKADKFYDLPTLLNKLKELKSIQENSIQIRLTTQGQAFKGFGGIRYNEYLTDKEIELKIENLLLLELY